MQWHQDKACEPDTLETVWLCTYRKFEESTQPFGDVYQMQQQWHQDKACEPDTLETVWLCSY
jgi:hypothetical protein